VTGTLLLCALRPKTAARDQAIALQGARVDLTPDGQRLQKYEKGHEGSYFAMLRGIDKFQNPPRPAPGPRRGPRKTETQAEAGGPGSGIGAQGSGVRQETTECPNATAAPGESNATASVVQPTPDPDRDPKPDEIPVVDSTDDEFEEHAPEMAAAQPLQQRLEAISGTDQTAGAWESGRPPAPAVPGSGPASPPEPGANTIEAIFGRPPSSGPAPREAGRAPPGG
jgi:hypothetical protein